MLVVAVVARSHRDLVRVSADAHSSPITGMNHGSFALGPLSLRFGLGSWIGRIVGIARVCNAHDHPHAHFPRGNTFTPDGMLWSVRPPIALPVASWAMGQVPGWLSALPSRALVKRDQRKTRPDAETS